MASAENPAGSTSFFQNLWLRGIYKRKQGRITRQVTFFAIAGTIALGAWRFSHQLAKFPAWVNLGIPWVVGAIGVWVAYRLVNMPNFADFLIAVEAEMSKVSWPTRTELIRGALVVLMMITILAFLLFAFDIGWTWFFSLINLQGNPT